MVGGLLQKAVCLNIALSGCLKHQGRKGGGPGSPQPDAPCQQ
jgi:hypothetical protein